MMALPILTQDKQVAFLQDGEFIGFVEERGAYEIKRSARVKGLTVEDHGSFFNVVYVKGIRIDVE